MFVAIFGNDPKNWSPDRHVNLGSFITAFAPQIDATKAIRASLGILIDNNGPAPILLDHLVKALPPREIISAQNAALPTVSRHLGQVDGNFALNVSQRMALEATLAINEGEIIAVNGPPGTGKTTFIQSAAASL